MIPKPLPNASRPALKTAERPAPVKGVNTADAITGIDRKLYARAIDNWTCRPDGLHVRPGWTVAETKGSAVTALLAYPGQVLARTDGDWIGDTLPNAGGVHLMAAKAGSVPQLYSGSAWLAAAIAGVDPTTLTGIVRHGRRLWAIEAGTMDLRYLGIDAIGGPTSVLPVGGLFKKGGTLVALGSISGDGGEDSGDMLAVVSSAGELAVYAGSNPDDSQNWSLRGVFEVPTPVGARCFARIGTSLGLLTTAGLLRVPDVLAANASGKPAAAMTRNVIGLTGVAALDSAHAEVTLIHRGADQWVRDPETEGWSRWTHLGATCWIEGHDGLYFGRADGKVCKLGAADDNGAPIRTVLHDAQSRFGVAGRKRFSRVRPQFLMAQPYQPRLEMIVDHRDLPAAWEAARIDAGHWFWPDIAWPMQPAQWTRETSPRLGQWRGIGGNGHTAGLAMGAQFLGVSAIYIGSEFMFESGGQI